ncbi:MAG TPA: 3-dehydroquinate synthase [Gemmatimonadaceae bacterium]|nr:3-dehydroquinate synthase [Gemmatimonadaceae bacterium]
MTGARERRTIDLFGSRILVGAGLLAEAGRVCAAHAPAHTCAVVTDDHVAPHWLSPLAESLRRDARVGRVITRVVPAGERNKTRESWTALTDWLLDEGCGRDTTVVALGGGVIGDLAGFVAATFLRGVPVVQVPTTLLAMVDAAIGGKTGVDTPAGKNLVGALHLPAAVIVDPDVLATLPPAVLREGLAEMVKHGAITGPDAFEEAARFAASCAVAARRGGRPAWDDAASAIARSAAIKADVVRTDPRESGRRQMLNAGHTVAHALERVTRFTLAHGDAVAIGLVAESVAGQLAGWTAPGTAERLQDVLAAAGLPTAIPRDADPDALLEAMRADKKNRRGRLRFALLAEIGRMGSDPEDPSGGWTIPLEPAVVREALEAVAAPPNERSAAGPLPR